MMARRVLIGLPAVAACTCQVACTNSSAACDSFWDAEDTPTSSGSLLLQLGSGSRPPMNVVNGVVPPTHRFYSRLNTPNVPPLTTIKAWFDVSLLLWTRAHGGKQGVIEWCREHLRMSNAVFNSVGAHFELHTVKFRNDWPEPPDQYGLHWEKRTPRTANFGVYLKWGGGGGSAVPSLGGQSVGVLMKTKMRKGGRSWGFVHEMGHVLGEPDARCCNTERIKRGVCTEEQRGVDINQPHNIFKTHYGGTLMGNDCDEGRNQIRLCGANEVEKTDNPCRPRPKVRAGNRLAPQMLRRHEGYVRRWRKKILYEQDLRVGWKMFSPSFNASVAFRCRRGYGRETRPILAFVCVGDFLSGNSKDRTDCPSGLFEWSGRANKCRCCMDLGGNTVRATTHGTDIRLKYSVRKIHPRKELPICDRENPVQPCESWHPLKPPNLAPRDPADAVVRTLHAGAVCQKPWNSFRGHWIIGRRLSDRACAEKIARNPFLCPSFTFQNHGNGADPAYDACTCCFHPGKKTAEEQRMLEKTHGNGRRWDIANWKILQVAFPGEPVAPPVTRPPMPPGTTATTTPSGSTGCVPGRTWRSSPKGACRPCTRCGSAGVKTQCTVNSDTVCFDGGVDNHWKVGCWRAGCRDKGEFCEFCGEHMDQKMICCRKNHPGSAVACKGAKLNPKLPRAHHCVLPSAVDRHHTRGCFRHCRNGHLCPWCGMHQGEEMLCCRRGWGDDPACLDKGLNFNMDLDRHHQCVIPVAP